MCLHEMAEIIMILAYTIYILGAVMIVVKWCKSDEER